MFTENLSTLKIHKLTKEQYERELAAGRIDENAIYLTPEEDVDLSAYATYAEIASNYETKTDASAKLTEAKTYADTVASGKSDANHNHDGAYDSKGAADTALASAKSYTDSKTSGLATGTVVDNKISSHNTSTAAHSDIRGLIIELSNKLNNFLDVDDTTTDQLSEVLTLINNNKGTLDSITSSKVNVSDIVDNLTTSSATKVLSAKQGVAIKALIDTLQESLDSHTHEIGDVSGLQNALDGKAAASHGTHVTYSSTAPVMDGIASVGSATTVARSDHKHPTDTSRAAQTALDDLAEVVAGKSDSGHGHNAVTATSSGFMTADMVTKLNGIETGANKITVDTSLSASSTNPVQNKIVNSAIATATSAISANTSAISANTSSIATLRSDIDAIVEISSAEIQALFA